MTNSNPKSVFGISDRSDMEQEQSAQNSLSSAVKNKAQGSFDEQSSKMKISSSDKSLPQAKNRAAQSQAKTKKLDHILSEPADAVGGTEFDQENIPTDIGDDFAVKNEHLRMKDRWRALSERAASQLNLSLSEFECLVLDGLDYRRLSIRFTEEAVRYRVLLPDTLRSLFNSKIQDESFKSWTSRVINNYVLSKSLSDLDVSHVPRAGRGRAGSSTPSSQVYLDLIPPVIQSLENEARNRTTASVKASTLVHAILLNQISREIISLEEQYEI